MSPTDRSLRELARLYGVQMAYHDVAGRRREASREALLAALRALGAPLSRPDEAPSALETTRQRRAARGIEPVIVAWEGHLGALRIALPSETVGTASPTLKVTLALETGEAEHQTVAWAELPEVEADDPGDLTRTQTRAVRFERRLPWGYHELRVEVADRVHTALVIAAPRRAYGDGHGDVRAWGTFLPLYAFRSGTNWGMGDFRDLGRWMAWMGEQGGDFVGTLPLLATFLGDVPFDPSPYAPVSRRFWNEAYIHVEEIPELADCPEAREQLGSSSLRERIAAQRASDWVDYHEQMRLKRAVLEPLARCLAQASSERVRAFQAFRQAHPDLERYATFRALVDRRHEPPSRWPERLREGEIRPGDLDEETRTYHAYVQWIAHEQLAARSATRQPPADDGAAEPGDEVGLYLDLPLGVHPEGFDPWRDPELYVQGASVGAPPDELYTQGQNWGFPPIHPERLRAGGHREFRAALRHHLRHATLLRIDHVMGFHRLFWIPAGLPATEGVYVRYPAEELYAITTLESRRHGTAIVGEDIGTVPDHVRGRMTQSGLHRMWVLPAELPVPEASSAASSGGDQGTGSEPDPLPDEDPVPRAALACLNTHDMPTFAAFWRGDDLRLHRELGIRDAAGLEAEREERAAFRRALLAHLRRRGFLSQPTDDPDLSTLVGACLARLAASPARYVLVNLEDLWQETRPQNVPGTGPETHPNWRRRTQLSFEAFCARDEVVGILGAVRRRRRQGDD